MAYMNGKKVLFSPNIQLNPVGRVTEKGGEVFNDYENNEANGLHSSASGTGTKANGPAQSVRGKFNEVDTEGNYLDIVGKGESDDKRSNAYALDILGNAYFAGDIFVGENNDKVATEKVIEELVNSAPETLNTLSELAKALGEDPNFATTMINELAKKVDKIEGKSLSTNDFTDRYVEIIVSLSNSYTHDILPQLSEHSNQIGNIEADVYQAPITTVPDTLAANKEYSFGEIKALNIVFPSIANKGDVVFLTFASGETATVLSIDTTNTSDIEVIPEPNCYYDIFGKFNGSIWLLNYSEYTASGV